MNRLPLSRRRFLQGASALAATGALPGLQVMRSARAATGTPRTLVVIHLAGGNDTLNTVVPYGNPAYATLRGALAIPAAQVLPLNSQQGLHPSLVGIKALYNASKVAVINSVGYPHFDYSHFEAMQIYWKADPTRAASTGWLGRTLDTVVAAEVSTGSLPDVLSGTHIGWESPASLIARNFTAPLLPPNPDWYWLPARNANQSTALARILEQPMTTTNLLFDAFLRNSRAALQAYNTVKAAGVLTTPVVYPDNNFASGLKFTAQLLRTDPDVQIVSLEQGSYDTHENQYDRHAGQLSELSTGLKAFMDDLAANGSSGRVLVLLWSEFARRVKPNANLGTDHGSAQALFLIGDGVKGGIYGAPPGLAPTDLIDGGNLKMAVDFRTVYATLLNGWLGLDAKTILGADWGALPVLL